VSKVSLQRRVQTFLPNHQRGTISGDSDPIYRIHLGRGPPNRVGRGIEITQQAELLVTSTVAPRGEHALAPLELPE
jgi:hypothetical protein